LTSEPIPYRAHASERERSPPQRLTAQRQAEAVVTSEPRKQKAAAQSQTGRRVLDSANGVANLMTEETGAQDEDGDGGEEEAGRRKTSAEGQ
jgi:hypothetical protein